MIADAEDAIVAAIKKALGDTVQTVETLPGPWDQDALTLAFRRMPGVWVYFDGGKPSGGARRNRLEASFMVYAVTNHASGTRERQRGNSRHIGAYEIIEKVVPSLTGQPMAGRGTLFFSGLRVLTPASAQRKGVAVYEMAFTLEMGFPAPLDSAGLADFAIFSGIHHVGNGPDTEHYAEIPTGTKEITP